MRKTKIHAILTEISQEAREARKISDCTCIHEYNDVKNKKYILPKVSVYDLVDGYIDEYQIQVLNQKGISVSTDGTSFLPTTSGLYKVIYYAENSFGKSETKEYKVEILEE